MTTSPLFPCQVSRQGNGLPCRAAPGKRAQASDFNGCCGSEEAVFGAENDFSRVSLRGRENGYAAARIATSLISLPTKGSYSRKLASKRWVRPRAVSS